MFNQLRGWEWLIIVALILLLFGAKRLPDAARGLGRSLRIFKAETKGLAEGQKEPDPTSPSTTSTLAAPENPAPIAAPAPTSAAELAARAPEYKQADR